MAPENQCATCDDVTRIDRGCTFRLRDLGGTGIEHARRRDPQAVPTCARLAVPLWFTTSLERLDLIDAGCELDRDYSTVRIDMATGTAIQLALVDLEVAKAGYGATAEERATNERNRKGFRAALARVQGVTP